MRASLIISQPVGRCQLHSEWGCWLHANHPRKHQPRNARESALLILRMSFSSVKSTTKLNYHRWEHAASSRRFLPLLHLPHGTTLQKVRGLKAGNHRESWETRDHGDNSSDLSKHPKAPPRGAPQMSPDLGVDLGFLRVADVLWKNDKVLQRYFVLVPSCSYGETLWPKQFRSRKGLLCHSLTLREVGASIRQEPPVCWLTHSFTIS